MKQGLALLFWMIGAVCGWAAEPAPKLERELLHVKYPIHVMVEAQVWDPLGYSDRRPKAATIAPRMNLNSNILRGPVFDVLESLRKNGLSLPKGSRALFSPGEELLYLELTADELELARTLFGPFFNVSRQILTTDIVVALEMKGKEPKRILETKSVPTISGQKQSYQVTGDVNVDLSLESVVGPDGDTMDVHIDATVGVAGKTVKIDTSWLTKISKQDSITIGKLGEADVVLRLTPHRLTNYWGPPVLETSDKKTKALEEIQESLKGAGDTK